MDRELAGSPESTRPFTAPLDNAGWCRDHGLKRFSDYLSSRGVLEPLDYRVLTAIRSESMGGHRFDNESLVDEEDRLLRQMLMNDDLGGARTWISSRELASNERALGNLLDAEGDSAKSDECFKLAIDRGDIRARVDWAVARMNRGDYSAGVRELLEEATALDKKAWWNLASYFENVENYTACVEASISSLNAGITGVAEVLALALYRFGNFAAAYAMALDALAAGVVGPEFVAYCALERACGASIASAAFESARPLIFRPLADEIAQELARLGAPPREHH